MNCRGVRTALRESFDQGVKRGTEVEEHVTGCSDCRNYAARLDELNGAFFAIPVEEMEPLFVADLHRAVAKQRSVQMFRPAFLGTAAIVLTLCAGLFGWQYAFVLEQADAGWHRVLALFSIQGVIDTNQSVVSALAAIVNWASQALEPVAGVSPSVQWMAVIAAGAAILLLNGFEFWRLRIAGGGRG